MEKNEEITSLANEIMKDIENDRIPLQNVLLKASRLSLILNIPDKVKLFKDWSKYAEWNYHIIKSFKANIEAAKDPNVSIASSNPSQYVYNYGNNVERTTIRKQHSDSVSYQSGYKTEVYNFALGVYTKWKFGNIAENIFEKKRKKTEPVLRKIFPDINQRLTSIEQNILSINSEDWKNAVASCRTLLMDIADVLNPTTTKDQKGKYINRLKDFVSPNVKSGTKSKLIKNYLEEIKKRIEYTSDLTQGGCHKERPTVNEAEDVVLYVYLVISELMEIYNNK